MVLKELIFYHLLLWDLWWSERTDFLHLLIWEFVVVMKELIFYQFLFGSLWWS